jgi:glycosyltransferase involved in cell wall biosynthesis
MTDVAQRRRSIAVWAGWPFPVHMAGEGMSRLLGFLVEGAAESGRVCFRVCVRPVNLTAARSLLESLRAREGEDWTLHVIQVKGDDAARDVPLPPGATALLAGSDVAVGQRLLLLGLAGAPLLILRAALRPLWRLLWNQGGLRLAVAARRDPVAHAPTAAAALRRLRLPVFRRYATTLEAWAAARRQQMAMTPVASACAAEGVVQEAVPDPPARIPDLPPEQVDAWLSLMADLVVPEELPGRRAMILPDALMLDFGGGWNPDTLRAGGAMHDWFRLVRQNLEVSEAVITFSRHVAQRHAVERLGADAAKLHVIPHAPPDTLPLLDFVPPTRRRDAATRAQAAELLRRHAALRGWSYLADFPFEHVSYIAVSTQERPSKNLPNLIEAARILLQDRFADIKLLMTTRLEEDPETPFLRVLSLIRQNGLGLDVLSVPSLPNREHAALYHAAAVTVHPAFFEGGDAPFPFSESVSVGTPCLMGRGPHTEELLERHPDLAPFVFDPYDAVGLADLIQDAVARRDEILEIQLAVHARMCRRRWAEVAEDYAVAASGRALVPMRRSGPGP